MVHEPSFSVNILWVHTRATKQAATLKKEKHFGKKERTEHSCAEKAVNTADLTIEYFLGNSMVWGNLT